MASRGRAVKRGQRQLVGVTGVDLGGWMWVVVMVCVGGAWITR